MKIIKEVKRVTEVNRNLDIIYGDSETRDKVIGLGLLDFVDGIQGLELVVISKDGKVGLVSEDEFEVRETDPLENNYITPGPIYENKENPYVNRNAKQFNDGKIPVESITEGNIMPIQQGADGALCQCEHGENSNNCCSSEGITDFHCFRCNSEVKIKACNHNIFYYDCPFCGCSLT